MRDFVYVSGRKVERLAATLPPKIAKQLRGFSVNAGPVGASLTLADWPAEAVLTAVKEIESAIHKQHHVRYFTSPELRSGHWFMADCVDMAYGIQESRFGPGGAAAVFLIEQGGVQLLLSGSAEYLRDRHVPKDDVGGSMSEPQAITRLLDALHEDAVPAGTGLAAPRPWPDGDDYPMANMLHVFSRHGLHPMSFLARAIRVSRADDGPGRIVLGTPLYVAHAVPD